MKGSDILCASQVATSICLSMEEPSSSSSSTIQLGLGSGRAIDRYNPIIRDSTRIGKSVPPCNSEQPPLSPKPRRKQNKKNPKNSDEEEKKKLMKPNEKKMKSSTNLDKNDNNNSGKNNFISTARKSWSCTRPGGFISPAGSTRYLLSDKASPAAGLSDLDQDLKFVPGEQFKVSEAIKTDELPNTKPPSSSPPPDQVVVLRVSLDCRGCEKKLRKHLSKVEGVTSFNIDFVAKKVTVIGNVTPPGILESISKLRNAKSWSSSPISSKPAMITKEP